jgi:hypothetical protein
MRPQILKPLRSLTGAALAAWLLAGVAFAQWDDNLLKPFVMDHRAAAASSTPSPADLSFLSDRPAGKDGFIRIQGGHLVKPDGKRIRFWGVHFTDWSPGSVEIPPKEDMPMWAATLARFGANIVRLHFLDLAAPRGIVSNTGTDTQSFDPQQLDRLDFEVSQFKEHGIYADLNLNVGHSYKAGDGVQDFNRIGSAKSITLFDPRIIELEKQYAKQILTHVNPYTKTEYRNETAIAIVEILNENGIGIGYRAPTPYYENELTGQYNAWLAKSLTPDQFAKLRAEAGVAAGAPVPRLTSAEVQAAPKDRYDLEVSFYMDLENAFYQDMAGYLKNTLGVKVPIIGTADHGHGSASYPMLASLSKLDIVDGHIYWEHSANPAPYNTAMVNAPLHSTIVGLSRTTFAGKPYTVSETNHPFPNQWVAEGMPITASYGDFQDWDMVITYTFEPKRAADWKPYVGDPFDISLDPVRMTEFAAGALIFRRADVEPARKIVERTYSKDQVMESKRLPATEQPYFTPGFPLSLPLQHGVRIKSLDGPPTAAYPPDDSNPIVSDTKQLAWYTTPDKTGVVTVETDRTQALVGFLKANRKTLKNLSADISNNFATLIVTSLDAKPLASSDKMLLTAGSRVTNTNFKWDLVNPRNVTWGGSPSLIEPVTGTVVLRNLKAAVSVTATALDGSGNPLGAAIPAKKTADGWSIALGNPVTTWYVLEVKRH